jgi:GT2 family glycosyltransferase
MSVSVSLVALNQRSQLERLLPTLCPAVRAVGGEILLVDNRSTDGVGTFVAERFPEVKTERNDLVTGYGGNHNLNLRRAAHDYFLVMNCDMEITRDDDLRTLFDFMGAQKDVGIVTARVVGRDGEIQGLNKRFPTVLDLSLRRFAPPRLAALFRSRLDRYEMRDLGYDVVCDVEFISGAFMWCRTALLRALHGFDTRYFLYFEDVDLCRRVQRSHRTVYLPQVRVIHDWGRASHRDAWHAWQFVRSATIYFRTWGLRLA